MSRYVPQTDEQIQAQLDQYSDDAISSRYKRVESVPVVGKIFDAVGDILGTEIKVGVDVFKAGKELVEKGSELIGWITNKEDNHRLDGAHDPQSAVAEPAYVSNTGYSSPHWNSKSYTSYAGSNATHVFTE